MCCCSTDRQTDRQTVVPWPVGCHGHWAGTLRWSAWNGWYCMCVCVCKSVCVRVCVWLTPTCRETEQCQPPGLENITHRQDRRLILIHTHTHTHIHKYSARHWIISRCPAFQDKMFPPRNKIYASPTWTERKAKAHRDLNVKLALLWQIKNNSLPIIVSILRHYYNDHMIQWSTNGSTGKKTGSLHSAFYVVIHLLILQKQPLGCFMAQIRKRAVRECTKIIDIRREPKWNLMFPCLLY